jgi:hypothetical protein
MADDPIPQDRLDPIIELFAKTIGTHLAVDETQYCCLEVGSEFAINVKYNPHFAGIIFSIGLGVLPPSYLADVLYYFVCLSGSEACRCCTFSWIVRPRPSVSRVFSRRA